MPMIVNLDANLTSLIKVLSIVLITSALGLELWNLYTGVLHDLPATGWKIPVYFERFVLSSHGIEAVIAAICAPSKNRSTLGYGVYTFFVGTVGLVELFKSQESEVP